MGSRVTAEERDRIARDYAAGRTYREIAADLGRPLGTVHAAARHAGVASRSAGRRPIWDDNDLQAILARIRDGETQRAIAAEHGVSERWVSKLLRRAEGSRE